MDTPEEVDDGSATGGLLGIATAEEHIRHQHAHTRAWVRFDQEEDRLTGFAGLLDTQRREDTVVDGVIQEQNFCRFNEDRGQRQQVVLHHQIHARGENMRQTFNQRTNRQEGEDGQQHADDACREVVNQHFEARFDLAINLTVEGFNGPAAQWTGNHRAEEHWHVGTNDDTHGGDRADHTTAIAAHQAATGITDQQRQQVGNHRTNQLGHGFVWQPSGGNKQRGDNTPGDKRPDIWHYHVAQKATKVLDLDLDI